MSIDVKIRNNIIINHSIIEPVWEFIGQTDWSLLAGYYNNLFTNKNLLNDLPGLLWLLTPARLSNFRDIWNVMELLVFNILTLLGVRNEHQGWKELKMRLPPLSFKINQPTVPMEVKIGENLDLSIRFRESFRRYYASVFEPI